MHIGLFPLCSFRSALTDHKFASAGREDIDVRMLGNGKSQSLPLRGPGFLVGSAPKRWTVARLKMKVSDSDFGRLTILNDYFLLKTQDWPGADQTESGVKGPPLCWHSDARARVKRADLCVRAREMRHISRGF